MVKSIPLVCSKFGFSNLDSKNNKNALTGPRGKIYKKTYPNLTPRQGLLAHYVFQQQILTEKFKTEVFSLLNTASTQVYKKEFTELKTCNDEISLIDLGNNLNLINHQKGDDNINEHHIAPSSNQTKTSPYKNLLHTKNVCYLPDKWHSKYFHGLYGNKMPHDIDSSFLLWNESVFKSDWKKELIRLYSQELNQIYDPFFLK